MCGIVGYVGREEVVDVLLGGLRRLEYRGYDSAGVAFFDGKKIEIRKSEGKLANVEQILKAESLPTSRCGIGHTRWATHGKPTTQNAHPHRAGHVVLIHNGIIENYLEIRDRLLRAGHRPISETDTELFAFMVLEVMERGKSLSEAVREAFAEVEGACSFVVMSEREPGTIVAVRQGSPLVVAMDAQGGFHLASDAQPIISFTRDVIFLEDGDMVIARDGKMEVFEAASGRAVVRKSSHIDWSPDQMDRGPYPHYMLKEIHEQPLVLVDTLNSVLDRKRSDPFPFAEQPGVELLRRAERMTLVACGTSYHSCMVGKYWLERWAGLPVTVELASEFRYRDPVVEQGTLIVGFSQSGETADTLAVIREMRKRGVPTLGVTNVRGSSISREASAVFYTSAGPEIGVAATKTFTAQLLMLFLWSGFLGLQRGRDTSARIPAIFDQLLKLPHVLDTALQPGGTLAKNAREVAKAVQNYKGFFFMGRGYTFPIALEGALKLKEIAYVHAEGYAAGELKHGPIAMIDEEMVVITIAPRDSWREKTVSNLQEVKARGAKIIGMGSANDQTMRAQCDWWMPMPELPEGADECFSPFLVTPLIQLLSYEIAVLKGQNVDQPRNLAKSVTVE